MLWNWARRHVVEVGILAFFGAMTWLVGVVVGVGLGELQAQAEMKRLHLAAKGAKDEAAKSEESSVLAWQRADACEGYAINLEQESRGCAFLIAAKEELHLSHGYLMWSLLKARCPKDEVTPEGWSSCQWDAMADHYDGETKTDVEVRRLQVMLSKAIWGWLHCACKDRNWDECHREIERKYFTEEQRP